MRCKVMDSNWGRNVVEKALAYAKHEWLAGERNVFHGIDPDGCMVDTPDVTWQGESLDCGWWKADSVNIGIPYSWGNASTIEEFDAGLQAGKFAGNVPEDKKRPVSHHTVGVDCSGLLTVCWGLPKKIATRDIPQYADIVENLEDIKQGDIFAKIGSHAMFFIEFVASEMNAVRVVDATRSTGKVSVRTVNYTDLFEKGYRIYRKK